MSLDKNAITKQDLNINSQLQDPSSVRDQIIKVQSAIQKRAKELFNDNKISLSKFQSISNECQQILGFASQINSIQFRQVITDMDEPAKKIADATNSLDKAAAKIQDTQKFFDILSLLTQLGNAVSNAISGGGIAAIGNLVKQLQNIGDRLNT